MVISWLLTLIHVAVCLFLIIVVLLQSGKAADLAGAFGGMGSQTAFGPRGSATLLSKATTIMAVLFMLTSLTLSIVATRAGGGGASSVLDRQPATKQQQAPAQKGAPAAQPAKPGAIQVTPGEGKPMEIPIPAPQTQGAKPTPPAKPATPPQQK